MRLTRSGTTGTGPTVGRTTSANQYGSPGWSIGDNVVGANGSAVWGESLLFSVSATRGAAPATLTATAGRDQATLTWAAVTGATKYQYRYKRTSAADTTYTTAADITGTEFTSRTKVVTGLLPGVGYTFQVRANGATGAWATATATPTTTVYNTDKTVRTQNGQFGAQGFTTGANAQGYGLDRAYASFSDTPLNNSTTTAVKVRNSKTTGCGTGVASCPGDTVLATLTQEGSAMLKGVLQFNAPTGSSVQLDPSTTYFLTFNEGVSSNKALLNDTADQTETADTGWSIANSALYRSSESTTWSIDTANPWMIGISATAFTHAAPTVTASVTAGARQASLGWTAVTGATKYQYRYKVTSEPDAAWTTPADITGAGFTSRSQVVTGLVPGIGYTFQVRANGAGGAWGSATATPTTASMNVGNLTETRTTDGTLSQASHILYVPFTTGGTTADSVELDDVVIYVTSNASAAVVGIWSQKTTGCHSSVTACPDAQVGTNLTRQGTAASGYITFSAADDFTLTGGTTYYLRISRSSGTLTVGRTTSDNQTGSTGWAIGDTVVNADGRAAWTESLSFALLGVEPLPAPTVTATASTDQVSLSWTAVTGATKYQYRYKVTSAADSTYTAAADITGTDFTNRTKVITTGLSPGTGYTFQVRANGSGGAWGSDTATFVTTVYNTDKTAGTTATHHGAQGFTTGAHAAGYRVDHAYVSFQDAARNDSRMTAIKVRKSKTTGCPTGASHCPDHSAAGLLGTLTQEGSAALRGTQQFNAPTDTSVQLDPNTTYFLTVNEGLAGTTRAFYFDTTVQTESGDQGWSIVNFSLYRSDESAAYTSDTSPWQIGIGATAFTYAKPTVTPTAGAEQVSLGWTAVTGATKYQYRYKVTSEADSTWTTPADITGTEFTNRTKVISGLVPGLGYTFQVRANGDTGAWGTATATPTQIDEYVSNLTETRSATNGSLSTSSTVLFASFTTGGASADSITLDDVVVYVAANASNLTAEIWSSKTTGCATGVSLCPNAKVGTTLTRQGSAASGYIFYAAAANFSLSGATTYYVRLSRGAGSTPTVGRTTSDSQTGSTGWAIGDTVVGTDGSRTWTESLSFLVTAGAPLPAPATVSATAGKEQVTLTWAAVTGATKYQVRYKQTARADSTYTTPVDASSTEFTARTKVITGLLPTVNYTLQVRANGATGAWGTATATPTTTVYNTDNTRTNAFAYWFGQAFTTGTNAAGYRLDRAFVSFRDHADNDSRMTSVKVRDTKTTGCASFVCPGDTVLATLTRDGSGALRGVQRFDAPAGTGPQLDPSTTYFLTVNDDVAGAGNIAYVNETRTLTESGDAGWSIDNGQHFASVRGGIYNIDTTAALQIGISATAFTHAAPANFRATVLGTTVTLQWDAVTGATKYQVRYKQTGRADSAYTAPRERTASQLSGTFLQLSPVSYTFQVRANGSTGAWATVTATPTATVYNTTKSRSGSSGDYLAQSFATSNVDPHGYNLERVYVSFQDASGNDSATTAVKVRNSKTTGCGTGVPRCPGDTVLGTFTHAAVEGQTVLRGTHAFNPPTAGVSLDRGDTYFVTVNEGVSSGRAAVDHTVSGIEEGDASWQIGDYRHSRTSEAAMYARTLGPFKIGIRASALTAAPAVTAAAGASRVRLTWSAVSGATTYQYRYKQTSMADTAYSAPAEVSTAEYNSRNKLISTGLTAGTGYTFQVRANGTTGAWGTATATPTTTVAAPANVRADPGVGSITLRWDAVGTADYEYRYKLTSAANYGSAVTVSGHLTTSVTVGGLTLGTSYDFQVRSKENTTGGWGSATASTLTQADYAGMVTNYGGGTHYLYSKGDKYVANAFTTGADASILWNVAVNLYDRSWRCQGRPEVGVWTASGSVPGSLHVALSDPGSGNVFNAPAGAVLSPRTTYFVVFRDADSNGRCPVWTKADDRQSGTDGWSIADSYVTKTGSAAWDGSSAGGHSLVFTVNRGVPASPPVHAPYNVAAHAEREDGGHLVALSWSHIPGARQYQYRLRAGADSFADDGWRYCGGAYSARTNTWHFRISGLEASTTYHFELRGVNPAGHGPTSQAVSATTLGPGSGGNQAPVVVPSWPAAPATLTAERGDGEVVLSWGAYNHIDNSLAGWEVSTNDGASWSDTGLAGTATSYTVTGLTNDTAYTFRVRAILGPSTGAASPNATATPRRYTTPPDAVTNIGVTHNGNSLTVTWDAPERATAYNVTYRNESNGTTARGAWDRPGTSLTITCDSRYPGQSWDCVVPTASYVVGIQASNHGGASAWRNSAPAAHNPAPPTAGTAERRYAGSDCEWILSGDGRVSGSWGDDCRSQARRGRAARYYSFTLTTRTVVTIDLKSSTDPYLYLKRGEGRYGEILYENDDFDGLNSRIQETLDAGTYTIEATPYAYGATGNFTLDVTGGVAGTVAADSDAAPRFTSGASLSVAENGTAVATVTAVDDDPLDSAHPPTFTLTGGADQASFSITSAGVLSFSAAPDFENPSDVLSTTPADAAGNNVYVVVVQAASGTGARRQTANHTVRVRVTNANDAPTGAPTLSGTATVGQALAADASGIADQDGLNSVSFGYQWVRVDNGDTDIASATGSSYTLASADQGKRVKVRVTYTDQGGFTNSVESAQSGVVAGGGSVPQAPDAVASVTVVHNGSSLSVSWTAPARATHYDVTYYRHDNGVNARAAWNRAGTTLTITCDSRHPGQNQNCVESGKNYTVAVRARNAGGESEWTNSAMATEGPDPVASVSVVHNGSSLSVSWAAPARATHYDVTYYRHDNGVNARAAWERAGTSLNITCDSRPDHQNCVVATASYTVAVRAGNQHGKSAWTNSSEVSAGSGPGRVGVADADAHAAGPLGGVRHLRFAVTLDAASGHEVAVDYATRDGTALESADYEPGVFGTLRFRPGETSKTVQVLVAQDASVQSCETMLLELSNPRGAAIADGVGVGFIHDGPPEAGTAWLFPSASDPSRRGVVRVVNRSAFPGTVSVTPTDDAGRTYPALALELEAGEERTFNSRDLEAGNPAIGLTGATGPGAGDWRLQFASATLDVQILPYVHAGPRREGVPPSIHAAGPRREGVPPSIAPQGALSHGFAAPMHATAPADANGILQVPMFNPADDLEARSLLRLVNPSPVAARVAVTAIDDTGHSPAAPVLLALPPGAACTVDAAQLESGIGLPCGLHQPGLGNGTGSWRLAVASTAPVVAMNLLSAPDGRLSNLSATAAPEADGMYRMPRFPAASQMRQGLLRVANRSALPGTVSLVATDATGTTHPPLTLFLKAGAATTLDANDLELGARAKGLTGSTGPARGPWRLTLSSDIPFEATTYTSAPDGFLTPIPPTERPTTAGAHPPPPVRTCPNPAAALPALHPAEAHVP